MSHRRHMIPCVLALLVAVMLFTVGGANPLAAGLGVAFLVCSLVMGTVMWLLMRQPNSRNTPSERPASTEFHDQPR